jgi:hypothetical protein
VGLGVKNGGCYVVGVRGGNRGGNRGGGRCSICFIILVDGWENLHLHLQAGYFARETCYEVALAL